jgi:hypothetical protein
MILNIPSGYVNFIIEEKKIIIHSRHVAGIWSMFGHATYASFIELINRNPFILDGGWEVVFSDENIRTQFKDLPEQNIFEILFKKINLKEIAKYKNNIPTSRWLHHVLYKNSLISSHNPFFNNCFIPSDKQNKLYNTFIDKYKIDLNKTISVCYRGTDKYKEAVLASPEEYLKITKEILSNNKDFKVLIQTDQKQARDLFVNELKDKCIFFEEVPVTETKCVIHALNIHTSRLAFSENLNTAIRIVAKCKYLVNHTGNLGCAIMMYRGHSLNTWLFDSMGVLQHEILNDKQ